MKLQNYEQQIEGKVCKWDNEPLNPVLEYYDHPGGHAVEGFKERQWLYTICPKCGYQWSLGKLYLPDYSKMQPPQNAALIS